MSNKVLWEADRTVVDHLILKHLENHPQMLTTADRQMLQQTPLPERKLLVMGLRHQVVFRRS